MPPRPIRNLIKPFHDALGSTISCVTATPLTVSPAYSSSNTLYTLYIGQESPVSLNGPNHLLLSVAHRYRIAPTGGLLARKYRVRTVAYYYALEDDAGHEVIAYHWHPEDRGESFPHIHLEAGAGTLRPEFHRAHLPTERIALEDFIRLRIRDFAVTPNRADYPAILDRNKHAYENARSWPISRLTRR